MQADPLLLPAAAALGFPLAAMALKRAMELTRDTWGVLFACNLAVTLVFAPLFLLPAPAFRLSGAWQPALGGLLFFLGQVAAFKSFHGPISIALPVQGFKVLLVALLAAWLLGHETGVRIWAASLLSVLSIYLLRDPGGREKERKQVRSTVAYSALAASAFAAFDVSIMAWSPGWGWTRLGPLAFLAQAALSLCLLPFAGKARFRYGAKAWGWLAGGAAGMALTSLALVLAIGLSGKATEVNLLFNSRCIWSVLFVWFMGRWFGNREAKSGRRAMAHRLEGAGLMMAAIVLALA